MYFPSLCSPMCIVQHSQMTKFLWVLKKIAKFPACPITNLYSYFIIYKKYTLLKYTYNSKYSAFSQNISQVYKKQKYTFFIPTSFNPHLNYLALFFSVIFGFCPPLFQINSEMCKYLELEWIGVVNLNVIVCIISYFISQTDICEG